MLGKKAQWMGSLGLSCLLFLLAFGASRTYMPPLKRAKPTPGADSFRSARQSQLVLVYVGKSTCSWCNHPTLHGSVMAIRKQLREVALQRSQEMVTIGLALDRVPEPGLKHLSEFGSYDQVFAGGGWSNELAFRYIWDELPGTPATPTIIVTERTLITPDSTLQVASYGIVDERVLVRKVGVYEIQRWVNDGMPVPLIDTEMRIQHLTPGG